MANNIVFPNSASAIDFLQSKYGSANFSSWQIGRKQWWSYIQYPAAGLSSINFFGTAVGSGGTNLQQTNIPKAGSFGQTHFLLKSISFNLVIKDWKLNTSLTDDRDTLFSDMVNGFVQAGVFNLEILSKIFCQIPMPFLQMPPADGRATVNSAGLQGLTLTTGTPNTFTSLITSAPSADLTRRWHALFQIDPNVLIEAEQSFNAVLSYPTGLIPIIAANVNNDTTNILYVGCRFDGIWFRPVQ